MSGPPASRVAVIGAGLSGLAAAWRAHNAGAKVAVFEAGPRIGGAVRSERHGEWLIERGPHTIQLRPEVTDLAAKLKLQPVIAGSGQKQKRFVVRGGRLVALPGGPGGLIFGRFLSWRTKGRIFRQVLARGSPPSEDLSFADFIRGRFGDEVLTWIVQPFVSGIYAGDPERLSTQYAFPRLWKALQARRFGMGGAHGLASFPGGLGELAEALGRALPPGTVHLNSPVESLRREEGRWTVHPANAPPLAGYDEVIVTIPAGPASRLRVAEAEPLRFLAEVPHPPLTVLNLGFPRAAVRHPLDGFGCLVPAVERRSILAIIFTSTLFSGRAPADHVAFTVMMGGSLQPQLAKPTAAEAWALAQPDVTALLGLAAVAPAFLEVTHHPSAVPQYLLSHGQVLAGAAEAEAAFPGLRLVGNFRTGISLPDRLAAG